ncbi:esterase/lipase family protein [Kitasatospora sp. cg17-2]
MPSYQSVFPPTPTRFIRLGRTEAGPVSPDGPIGEEEEAFILSALAAYAPSAVEDELPEAGLTLGENALTPRIVRRIQAVDRKVGRGVAGRPLWFVREAHAYLGHEEMADAVRAEVAGVLAATGARTVVAHSLGSVVVYDLLSRGEAPGVAQLVMCGSPLSWLAGRKGIHSEGEPLAVPAGVEWTNLYASKDFVTGCAGLSRLAIGITDIEVNNGSFPASHDVHRYLGTPDLASLILKSCTA